MGFCIMFILGVPQTVKDKKLKQKGMSITMSAKKLMITKRKDRKEFTMLSTAHTANPTPTGKHNYQGDAIIKPECVKEYNKYMNAVDRNDQMVNILFFMAIIYVLHKSWKFTLTGQCICTHLL